MTILSSLTSIIAIVFMIIFIFIGIWLFVIALKAYKQLRYKNYILEKIYSSINGSNNRHRTTEEIDNLFDFDNDTNFDTKKIKPIN